MSRTRRIYNRIIKKAHRINLLKQPGMSLEKQVETGEINNPLRNSIHQYGLVYHPFASWLCMGKCPCCRNHDLDPRHQRKVRQREFARGVCFIISACSVRQRPERLKRPMPTT